MDNDCDGDLRGSVDSSGLILEPGVSLGLDVSDKNIDL